MASTLNTSRRSVTSHAAILVMATLALCAATSARSQSPTVPTPAADVALIVSIDVSESVDDARYELQMDGIAKALEDSSVISTITSGPAKRILFAMVVWADKSELAIPWVTIANKDDALAVAERVRHLKRYGGEFTCMARMFTNIQDVIIPALPMAPSRVVVDVSGDGIDNCSPDDNVTQTRDALVKSGVTINGLPAGRGRSCRASARGRR